MRKIFGAIMPINSDNTSPNDRTDRKKETEQTKLRETKNSKKPNPRNSYRNGRSLTAKPSHSQSLAGDGGDLAGGGPARNPLQP